MNAVTHSYTIMPVISMSGNLIGPVFLCLQEPTGKLGPRGKQLLYQANNIHVTCSKSGKLTKTHMRYWAENVLHPSASKNTLLLLESWSGQTDLDIYDGIFTKDITCERMQIPSKTTDDIEPLDPYCFRQWKYLKQKICDRIAIDRIKIDIIFRNNILEMHSLIHNQLSARKFSPMIKYAWFSTGYLSKNPGDFENV